MMQEYALHFWHYIHCYTSTLRARMHACMRFPKDLTTEQKITECEKCYKSQTETTEYCEHMVKYGNKAMFKLH